MACAASGAANDDVVDGDEDQLDRVSNEAHDGEADRTSHGNFLELLRIGLRAPLDEAAGVMGELEAALDEPSHW
eukprot:CAMPEP_0183430772 /NCGR_PEP_ID=MMETSP0370-20130417/53172_1 /TAXON_ID=268820 /ORGANISM="Peridinium aciculiferum, Strain PAER-2" /LENGTH=73 /DNA_ID=CAMNT_0025616237 /DNA_START=87 /DNA_END=305 /DNA_ORIENTATION=+